MKALFIFCSSCILLLMCNCKSDHSGEITTSSLKNVPEDIISGSQIADTIVYDVIIKNPYPEDKWTEKCLRELKRDEFIGQLFENVYSGKAIAYDLINNAPLSQKDIRQMEKAPDFDRSKIGKIQFTESWVYDKDNNRMFKKVIAVALGYELFDSEGNLIGHKPLFKVMMN